MIKDGTADYTFIEVMACPGGCIGGGGQPVNTTFDIKKMRQDSLYDIDDSLVYRKSHENPEVITLYQDYLEALLSVKKLIICSIPTIISRKKQPGKP